MRDRDRTIRELLLSYVGLLAERHAYGPGEGFEYALWDDLLRPAPTLVSEDERGELVDLVLMSGCWVSFDLQTGMLQLLDVRDWVSLLERRDH
jgi:hypothetical protein